MRFFLQAFVLVLLTACGSDSDKPHNSRSAVLSEINTNKELWEASNIQSYTYTYSPTPPGDCPGVSLIPTHIITVENGEVVSVMGTSGESIDEQYWDPFLYPTIDEIFLELLEKAETDYAEFSKSRYQLDDLPSFDETFGYPVEYYYDETTSTCDSKGRLISDFQ